jgi:hypothetical protein
MQRIAVLEILLAALVAQPALAQGGPGGTWRIEMARRTGGTSTGSLVLAVGGDSLSGAWSVEGEPERSVAGTLRGDSLFFGWALVEQGMTFTAEARALMSADSLTGTLLWRRPDRSPLGDPIRWTAVRTDPAPGPDPDAPSP